MSSFSNVSPAVEAAAFRAAGERTVRMLLSDVGFLHSNDACVSAARRCGAARGSDAVSAYSDRHIRFTRGASATRIAESVCGEEKYQMHCARTAVVYLSVEPWRNSSGSA